MSIGLYSREDEENILIRKNARSWQRSGLITEEQLRIINDRTYTQLKQTNLFFRILFFVFTIVCTAAVAGFFFWIIKPSDETFISIALMMFAFAAYALSEYMIRTKNLYRYGMEEALAAESVFFCSMAMAILLFRHADHHSQSLMTTLLCSLLSFWIYIRFGYLYAAVAGYLALCSLPFHLELSPENIRTSLALFLGTAFLVHAFLENREVRYAFRRLDHDIVMASLFCGLYIAVNLRLPVLGSSFFMPSVLPPFGGVSPALYWTSYILTFLIPAGGIYYGLKERERLMIIAGSAAAVATLATNKDYLGMTHYAWDPAVMGIFLVAAALMIIRWLGRGKEKMRYGYTAENILKPESSGIDLAALGAAAVPAFADAPQPLPRSPSAFEGGDSGGGGADDRY